MRRLTVLLVLCLGGAWMMPASPAVHAAGSHASAVAEAQNLALPESVIDPANPNEGQGPVDAGIGTFADFHQTWTGYQSGVEAGINLEPVMGFIYRGSVFDSAASAQTYAQEGAKLTAAYATPTDCSRGSGNFCQSVSYTS